MTFYLPENSFGASHGLYTQSKYHGVRHRNKPQDTSTLSQSGCQSPDNQCLEFQRVVENNPEIFKMELSMLRNPDTKAAANTLLTVIMSELRSTIKTKVRSPCLFAGVYLIPFSFFPTAY